MDTFHLCRWIRNPWFCCKPTAAFVTSVNISMLRLHASGTEFLQVTTIKAKVPYGCVWEPATQFALMEKTGIGFNTVLDLGFHPVHAFLRVSPIEYNRTYF